MLNVQQFPPIEEAHGKGIWALTSLPHTLHESSGHFLTGGCDGRLQTWRFPSSKHDDGMDDSTQAVTPVRTFGKHTLPIVSVAASRERDLAVSAGLDGVIKIWSIGTEHASDPKVIQQPVITDAWALSVSRDGERIVTGGCNGVVQLVDSTVCMVDQTYSVATDSSTIITDDKRETRQELPMVMSLMLRDDAERAVVALSDGAVIELDVETGKSTFVTSAARRHAGPVRCVRYVLGERGAVVSASDDGLVHVCDVTSGDCTAVLKAHSGMVFSADASSDGRYIVSGGSDHKVLLWDRKSQRVVYESSKHLEPVWGVAWVGADDHVVSVGDDARIGILGCTATDHT